MRICERKSSVDTELVKEEGEEVLQAQEQRSTVACSEDCGEMGCRPSAHVA